jgi:hypothetical protein
MKETEAMAILVRNLSGSLYTGHSMDGRDAFQA